jgi:hypothetical protein
MNGRRVVCGLVALVPIVAACGGGGSASTPTAAGAAAPGSSGLVATRWWSNSADRAGSRIDPAHPDAAAAKLSPSRLDYCGMLKQTVAAGRSILPGATADDPALLASTKAFVAELEAVAPPAVAGPWRVLGSAVVAIVGSGGNTRAIKEVDAAAVQTAAGKIAADAKRSCGVDLSSAKQPAGG